jgi:hypothetical protein
MLPKELSKLDKLTSGGLLEKLRKLGLPEELDKRIADAVDRRNDLVHRTFEDPELARAIGAEGTSMLWSNASSDSPWTAGN